MAGEAAEKTQEPTAHRRQQAREEGQVAKSQDLGSAAILLSGSAGLLFFGKRLIEFFFGLAQLMWGSDAWLRIDTTVAVTNWNQVLWSLVPAVLPLLLVVVFAATIADILQVGLLWVPGRLMPDISRLDPIQGLGRIFSMAGAVRLTQGIIKILLVAGVALWCVYGERAILFSLAAMELPQIAAYLAETLIWTSLKIGGFLFTLAILDYGYQWWRNEQDMRMTVEEVREEMKTLQGDPQVIARRRTVQRQLVLNRLNKSVPRADVVITNPTELAIAIQYEPDKMAAPVVLAKGAGMLAQRIRKLALEHGVPVLERKPLAQALYKEVEINQPIPHGLYSAVAELLAYVYQLKGKQISPERRRAG